jgi:VWFA-related protein
MVWGHLQTQMRKSCAIMLAGALAVPAAAQTQAALAAPAQALPVPASLTIRRLVPEVQMVFAAQDRRGRPALNLSPLQISVLDNGAAAAVTSFQPAAALPLRIALLLDASDSMRPGFAAQRQAALAFLRRLQRDGSDQICTLAFAAREAPEDASDPASVLSARQLGGQTALYDALITAAASLQSSAPARRVLLLLSDGDDNYSRSTLADAIITLQRWNIAVYSLTIHSPRLEFPGDRVLRQLAGATGGRAFLLRNYAHSEEIFKSLENELSGQYVVGFRPAGSLLGGEFHSVKIVAPGLTIRSRSGYYVSY